MDDLNIRRDRHAGRITLTRPRALNALTHEMANAIKAALDGWRDDPAVRRPGEDGEAVLAVRGDREYIAVDVVGRAADGAVASGSRAAGATTTATATATSTRISA